jgi:large subunit ribosomal protein L25
MSATFELNAVVRDDKGKGASRRLRHANLIPAILYGAQKEAATLSLQHHEVKKALQNEAFYSHILTLHLPSGSEKVVLKDMQRHPYKPIIMHMDFLRVDAKAKINMRVPLHFLGEEIAPGVKNDGGIVSHLMSDVEVSCLPGALPEFVEVDLSNLEVGGAIHLSELKLPEGVELVILSHGHDEPVANIHMPRAAEEEAVAAPVSAEVPASEVKADAPAEKDAKKGKD